MTDIAWMWIRLALALGVASLAMSTFTLYHLILRVRRTP